MRRAKDGDIRRIYFPAVITFGIWGAVALNLAQPLTLVIISANVGGFVTFCLCVHTIIVNRRFLPRELQAPLWREIALVVSALFYGFFVVLALGAALR